MTIQELADRAEVTTRTIRYYVEQGVLPPPEYGRPAEYTEEHVERLALIKRLKEQYLPLEEIRDTMQRLSLAEVEQLIEQYSPPAQETIQQQKLDSATNYLANVLGRGVAREQLKRRAEPEPEVEDERRRTKDESSDEEGGRQKAEGSDATQAETTALRPVQPPPAMSPPPIAPGAPVPATRPGGAAPPAGATAGKTAAYIQPSAPEADEDRLSPVGPPSTSSWERVNLGEGVELHYQAETDAHAKGKVAKLIEAARRILGKDPGNGE